MSDKRRSRKKADTPVELPAVIPLPPESMDVLGALSFMRALLHEPNALIDERARITFLGLVSVALKDLEPAPLPRWLFAWQAFGEEQQRRVDRCVTRIVKENERRQSVH